MDDRFPEIPNHLTRLRRTDYYLFEDYSDTRGIHLLLVEPINILSFVCSKNYASLLC